MRIVFSHRLSDGLTRDSVVLLKRRVCMPLAWRLSLFFLLSPLLLLRSRLSRGRPTASHSYAQKLKLFVHQSVLPSNAMGKRRAQVKRNTPVKKERPSYDCVVCRNKDCIEFPKFPQYKRMSIGLLFCRLCGLQWQGPLHHLSLPCDLYSDWIDALEEAHVP